MKDLKVENILPNALRKGDLVGIVSPSKDITSDGITQLENGICFLNSIGLEVIFANNTGMSNIDKILTPKQKGDDINQLFADKNIKAIFCSRGGEGCFDVLPYINYNVIKENPKIFAGFSDITHILDAIYVKTGLITFNASNVKTLGEKLGERMTIETLNDFKDKIIDNNFAEYKHFTDWKCIRSGKANGTLIGGNLHCFTNLLGTEYSPNFDNKILFLEELGMESTPYMVIERLNKLKNIGAFEKINGIWVGNYEHDSKKLLEDMILEVTKNYSFPILKCNDFGHNNINVVIPVGAKVILDATKMSIEIIDKVLIK
jgi:muramoyltetrapeptide carboxypeptidase